MPVLFSMERRSSPRAPLPCLPYSCSPSASSIQSDTCARFTPTNRIPSLASKSWRISSRLNLSASCTLIINPQHVLSLRLILYWKQALPSGSSCIGKDSPLCPVQKPYYCGDKIQTSGLSATRTLLGLAPVLSTRASAAHHRESISACQPANLGAANDEVT